MIWDRRGFIPTILGLLTIIFFAPVFGDQSLGGSDFREIHYPLLKFVVESVHEDGIIPLWNPHQFLGYSVIGNPQYGLFYPPNWLLLLFSDIYQGVAIVVALHVFWLGLGMTYLARQWGANPLAALLAGVVTAFGGLPAAKLYAGHYAVLLTLAWLPWIIAGYRLASRQQHPVWAIPGGLALAMAILAGHPQFVYIALIGTGLLWFYQMAIISDARLRLTYQLGIVLIIGLTISAIAWLPAWDYQSKTVRGATEHSTTFANQHAVPPKQLSTLIIPDLFGMPLDEEGYWGEPFYEEMIAYVGLLPLILLALAWRRREWWFWGGLALLGIILSLGMNGGLYALQYWLVPLARGFRAPGRFLTLTSIGLAMILALALTYIQQLSIEERRQQLLSLLRRAVLPGLIVLWGGAGMQLSLDHQHSAYLAQQLAISGVFLLLIGSTLWAWTLKHPVKCWVPVLLVLIGGADVWVMSWSLKNTDQVELSRSWQAARTIIPPNDTYGRVMQMLAPPGIINGASWTGHLSPQGYDPIAPDGWFRLMDATGEFIEDPGSAVNRVFGVRYVISGQPLENYNFFSAQFFTLIDSDGPYHYYENELSLPRAYLVERYEVESDMDTARRRITDGEVDRGDTVLLTTAPDCSLSGYGGTASITRYEPNQVTIDVQADGPGLLVLTDQYDDDWQVTVDGKEAELLQANTTTRAVCVSGGAHTVQFTYRPWSLQVGAIISIMGCLLAPFVGFIYILPKRALRM